MPGRPWPTTKCLQRLLLVGALMSPSAARADIITCAYTEPFIRTLYDTSLKTMTVVHDVEKRREILDQVSMREIRPGVFEFRSARGGTVQVIERNCRGSDGMSERAYPYEAQWIAQKLYGGCASNRLKSC
jgi:uncharacterized membrane protein